MLTALEEGVKGGVWFSLIDKVWHPRNLDSSWLKVRKRAGAAGVDHQSIEQFGQDLDANLTALSEELRRDEYRPQAVRRVWIPKPGSDQKRPLGIPTVRDRVVQGALRQVIEPIFEQGFAPQSYGFRPGRGCKDALRRVDQLLKSGSVHVVDADIQSYFDTIPQNRLLEKVRRKIADGRVLGLIEAYLSQGVLEGLAEWTPEAGTPQGAVISPLLANVYLDDLDHHMARLGHEMIRYADDLVVLCRSTEEAQTALAELQRWMAQEGLTLHPAKTRVVDARTDRFDFLGYRFERGTRRPREKSLKKLKDAIRSKTPRTNGLPWCLIIGQLNVALRGWFAYYKHSRRWTFIDLDCWIRRRLRSFLRRCEHRRGSSHGGADHQRWSNAFFTAEGLFNLMAAYQRARQSPSG
jgi:RNA-directed DNA polymerase